MTVNPWISCKRLTNTAHKNHPRIFWFANGGTTKDNIDPVLWKSNQSGNWTPGRKTLKLSSAINSCYIKSWKMTYGLKTSVKLEEIEREKKRETFRSFFLGLLVGFFLSSLEGAKHISCSDSFQLDPINIHSKDLALFASITCKPIGSSSSDRNLWNLLHKLKSRLASWLRKLIITGKWNSAKLVDNLIGMGTDVWIVRTSTSRTDEICPRGIGVRVLRPCLAINSIFSRIISGIDPQKFLWFSRSKVKVNSWLRHMIDSWTSTKLEKESGVLFRWLEWQTTR